MSATRQARPQVSEVQKVVVSTVFTLSPAFSPANGPENAQGIAYMHYDDEVVTLNSGEIVVSGLPEGDHIVWLIFGESLTADDIFSVPVATFTVVQNDERTEANLMLNFSNVIDVNQIKQLVVTSSVPELPDIGTGPVAGAVGYPDGPGAGTAVLATNIIGNGNPEPGNGENGEQDAELRQPLRRISRSPLMQYRRRH